MLVAHARLALWLVIAVNARAYCERVRSLSRFLNPAQDHHGRRDVLAHHRRAAMTKARGAIAGSEQRIIAAGEAHVIGVTLRGVRDGSQVRLLAAHFHALALKPRCRCREL